MCELGIGQMRYRKAGRIQRLYIDGGFAQVHDNRVTVLTGQAVPAEEITDEMIAQAERGAVDEQAHTLEAVEARRRAHRRAATLRDLRARP
jgi:F-type H+-transporting ATPase subunit epsilon